MNFIFFAGKEEGHLDNRFRNEALFHNALE